MTAYDAEQHRLYLVSTLHDLRAHEARAEAALAAHEAARANRSFVADRASVVEWHAMLVVAAFLRWTR